MTTEITPTWQDVFEQLAYLQAVRAAIEDWDDSVICGCCGEQDSHQDGCPASAVWQVLKIEDSAFYAVPPPEVIAIVDAASRYVFMNGGFPD